MTTFAFTGPKTGADRGVLLAHGAGSDLDAPALVVVAEALAAVGVPALRFNYPYRDAGRKAPDRPPVLLEATRAAVAELADRTGLAPERLVIGGRSMGGRYCSLVAGDAVDPLPVRGLLLLGYPLHAAGKPEKVRADHFPRLDLPVLFVSGTRDSLAAAADLERAALAIPGPVSWCWLESGDHGFKPLKRSGLTPEVLLAQSARAAVEWVGSLP